MKKSWILLKRGFHFSLFIITQIYLYVTYNNSNTTTTITTISRTKTITMKITIGYIHLWFGKVMSLNVFGEVYEIGDRVAKWDDQHLHSTSHNLIVHVTNSTSSLFSTWTVTVKYHVSLQRVFNWISFFSSSMAWISYFPHFSFQSI